MGTLANSIFQGMLGWVRVLILEIWTTVSSADSRTMLRWAGTHWKETAIVLCAVGAVIDLIIYIIRWQPYRVWKSFLHRKQLQKEEEEPSELIGDPDREDFEDRPEEANAFSSGSEVSPEEVHMPLFSRKENEYVPAFARDESPREETMVSAPKGEIQEDDVPRRNVPEGTTAAFDQALRPRRRRSVTRILSDERQETTPPDQLIDRYAAYRRPVYPRSWKEAEGQDEETE